MSEASILGGTCERRTVYDESNYLNGGGIPCHRDAVGTYEFRIDHERIALMALCEGCADFYRETTDMVVEKISDTTEYGSNGGVEE